MLTECLPASPTASEEPVRVLANDLGEKSPSLSWTGRDSAGSPPQRELRSQHRFEEEVKKELALLLTEREMRVLSPFEAQELISIMGELLQILTVSPQTTEVSEVQLSNRPLLVLFREETTVSEAYRLLHSLLELSKPKPRGKSSLVQQSCLVKALRRGMETGDVLLTLQSSVNSRPESNGSAGSVDSSAKQSEARQDVRHSTYRRLESLEETILELENTLIEISGHSTAEHLYTEPASKGTPGQMTPASEDKRPAVPPKPSSLSPASTQVNRSHLLCRFLHQLLSLSSLGVCGNFSSKLLLSAP